MVYYENPETVYLFVIDTDRYVGDFASSLCAYMTGKDDVHRYQEAEVRMFCEDLKVDDPDDYYDDDYILYQPDEHGQDKPVHIWPSETLPAFNTLAIYLDTLPIDDVFDLWRRRAKVYCDKKRINIINFRLLKYVTTPSITTLVDWSKVDDNLSR